MRQETESMPKPIFINRFASVSLLEFLILFGTRESFRPILKCGTDAGSRSAIQKILHFHSTINPMRATIRTMAG